MVALGNDVRKPQLVESPIRKRSKRLRAVALPRVLRRDAAALLRAAFAVKAVEQHLADALAVKPHGKVDCKLVSKIAVGDIQKVVVQVLALPVLAVVVAPPLIARIVEAERVVGSSVLLRQRRERQMLRADRRDLGQVAQLVFHGKAQLLPQLRREILELGGAQALVARVVLAVDPLDAPSGKVPRKFLHRRRVNSLIAVERLFNVVNERVAAALGHAK